MNIPDPDLPFFSGLNATLQPTGYTEGTSHEGASGLGSHPEKRLGGGTEQNPG